MPKGSANSVFCTRGLLYNFALMLICCSIRVIDLCHCKILLFLVIQDSTGYEFYHSLFFKLRCHNVVKLNSLGRTQSSEAHQRSRQNNQGTLVGHIGAYWGILNAIVLKVSNGPA